MAHFFRKSGFPFSECCVYAAVGGIFEIVDISRPGIIREIAKFRDVAAAFLGCITVGFTRFRIWCIPSFRRRTYVVNLLKWLTVMGAYRQFWTIPENMVAIISTKIVEICGLRRNLAPIPIGGSGVFLYPGRPILRLGGRAEYLSGASIRRLRIYIPATSQW